MAVFMVLRICVGIDRENIGIAHGSRTLPCGSNFGLVSWFFPRRFMYRIYRKPYPDNLQSKCGATVLVPMILSVG